ncbi:hypothetical protein AURDEDRAFT_188995 [Auricularia subglabra TFB-10046 SS5]|nr:hypothetical protein AURDEDRAFT_188995 [Auricularia subglabra TFB-10046 SS5]
MASGLLPFQTSIVQTTMDPLTSELTLIARGLGLRTVLCTLLKIYNSPQTLVLLMNASQDEENGIGHLLGLMGCRNPGLRVVTYEMNRKERRDLYKGGGIISVTSRILVGDMLTDDVPRELITGLLLLHAEKVTAESQEAFIISLYREKNQDGFLKAFSDQPEQITHGLSPLRTIMKALRLRKVQIFPRFHEEVQQSLERRKADVVELHQPMTEAMTEIHEAIMLCMNATISELKRSNSTLDLDDLTLENAYFRMFDAIVRKQLDPVWHKVGPKTKQLVGDLTTLRNLLGFLLSYDALALHTYLESIIHSNTVSNATGEKRQNQSPWLFLDAADLMIKAAKGRCYITTEAFRPRAPLPASALDWDDEEGWAALQELEGVTPAPRLPDKDKKWLPEGMEPVLEELPKWPLLVAVLQEIEETMMAQPLPPQSPASDTVLVMASSQRTCDQLREYLGSMDPRLPAGQQGRAMMERRLREYLRWKARLHERDRERRNGSASGSGNGAAGGDGLSEAMKRKDAAKQNRALNRRRVRGGAPGTQPARRDPEAEGAMSQAGNMMDESDVVEDFLATQGGINGDLGGMVTLDEEDDFVGLQLATAASLSGDNTFLPDDDEQWYGLVAPEQTVLVRAYSDDADDQLLAEVKPRFIVMFEPNQEFIRRIEVYRSLSPGLAVRVYFMLYEKSAEEVKYLTAIRKEKDCFERLIKERGSMLMVLGEDVRPSRGDLMIKTLSTRIAGGGKVVETTPPQVIVDSRELNSSLPGLLYNAGVQIIPVTLTVGDYILSPDMCVERKSLPDLVASFNNGRLYTQCELMSAHYKHPMLLIEFEEHKAFSMEIVSEVKSYAKGGKYPAKKAPKASDDSISITAVQSKLVLLTLSFPRLRIIWSSSPYSSADIFKDLKANEREPDAEKAMAIGAEDGELAATNAAAEDLLRSIPGITAKNVKHVMSKIRSVRELCELELSRIQDILGIEPGKVCWDFLHKGESSNA